MFTPTRPPILRVGIIRTSSIGDVVLSTACLDVLCRLGLSDQAIFIGMAPSLELVELSYPKVGLFDLKGADSPRSKPFARALEHLKNLHLIVDLQMNLRSRMLCRALKRTHGVSVYTIRKNAYSRGQMVMGSRFRRRTSPLPHETLYPSALQYQAMVDGLLEALAKHLPTEVLDKMFGYEARPHLPFWEENFQAPWLQELKFGRWLAIAPGAAYEQKRAPVGVFKQILFGLKDRFKDKPADEGLSLVFLGTVEERSLALKIFDQVEWPFSVLNLAGKLSLPQSQAVLRQSDAVLTNDSALAHIGEAVGTPASILFGPTVEGFGFAPWRQDSESFSADLGCRPCSKHGKNPCRFGDSLCFYKLDIEAIVQHLYENLTRERNKDG